MKEGEKVLVFPTALLASLFEGTSFQGFVPTHDESVRGIPLARRALSSIIHHTALSYQDRAEMENDPNFKQLIPYCLFQKDDKYFVYRRTKKGGESRLHELWSLGIGGHINPCDIGVNSEEYPDYATGFHREIQEEAGLFFKNYHTAMQSIIGLINDDSNDVGKVHFGIVHKIELAPEKLISTKDPAIADGQWLTQEEIRANFDKFENWSKLIIEKLFPAPIL
jgi:predicted NUDIX family phosphoesterase